MNAAGTERVLSPLGGYALDVPAGWMPMPIGYDDSVVVMQATEDDDAGHRANLVVMPVVDDADYQALAAMFHRVLTDFAEEPEMVPANDHQETLWQLQGTYRQGVYRLRLRLRVVRLSSDLTLVVTATDAVDAPEREVEEIQELAGSIVASPQTGAAPDSGTA